MLRILGSAKRACDGLNRRDLLRAGSLGLAGLGLADLLRLRGDAKPSGGSFGKAKSCILLYLYGAPSQLETWDLKPDAPSDHRSMFKPIATTVPGLSITEHFPRMAKRMDRATLIRTLTHQYPIHGAAFALSGVPTIDIPMEVNANDPRHWPYLGSVLDYLRSDRGRSRPSDVPNHMLLPWRFSSRSRAAHRAGPYAGFLGSAFNPVLTEFVGEPSTKDGDPYRGIQPGSTFQLTTSGSPGLELSHDRLGDRKNLLAEIDAQQKALDSLRPVQGYGRFQELAFSLMTSRSIKEALDLKQVQPDERDRYGPTLFGQATLAARRLSEAGVPLVTIMWDEYGPANTSWDTHIDQETRLKDELCPGLDASWSALMDDLERSGRLDETLVVVMSEHGRTPKLNNARGGGREHWSWAYCALLAGAGVPRGRVIGATDSVAGYPKDRPVSPKDLLATMYHLLGIDPATELQDRLGRPVSLVPDGSPLPEVVG